MDQILANYLLPILGGHIFMKLTYRFRYNYNQINRDFLSILHALVAGMFFLAIATIFIKISIEPCWPGFEKAWDQYFNKQLPIRGVLTVGFALIATAICNSIENKEHAKERNIYKSNNTILQTLYYSAKNFLPILVTLKSRKVYLGNIIRTEDDPYDSPNIGLIPLMSGYRDIDKQKVKFNHDYIDAANIVLKHFRSHTEANHATDAEKLNPLDFIVVFSLDDVLTFFVWQDDYPLDFDEDYPLDFDDDNPLDLDFEDQEQSSQ